MPLLAPQQPNQVFSADIMSDALYNGDRFGRFKVLDDFNREAYGPELRNQILDEPDMVY